MCKYVLIEDVQKIISDYKYHHIPSINTAQSKINSLPSISFEEIIHQLKRKNKKSPDYCDDKLAWPVREKLIEEFEELINLPK